MTLAGGVETVAERFDVSRETLDRLSTFVDLLLIWNRRINLISRGTESTVWHRHVLDSAQLWSLRPATACHWLDLGSGGGFPGLIVAILAHEQAPELKVTLVESDQRKAAFLGVAARTLDLSVTICAERLEQCPAFAADVLSARALAPLSRLLEMTAKHRQPGGTGLFPKGETVHKEIVEAGRLWRFEHRLHPSVTDPAAAIVEVGALARV